MNIIQLITNFTNSFNENFGTNITPFNLEEKIKNIGDKFTKQLYEEYLSQLDETFKWSEERLQKYYIKETKKDRNLVSTIGEISFQSTRYVDKLTNECYYFINDIIKDLSNIYNIDLFRKHLTLSEIKKILNF